MNLTLHTVQLLHSKYERFQSSSENDTSKTKSPVWQKQRLI